MKNTWYLITHGQMAFSHYSWFVVGFLSFILAIGVLTIFVMAFKSK